MTRNRGPAVLRDPCWFYLDDILSFGLEAALLHHSLSDLLEAGDVGASHQVIAQAVLGSSIGGFLVDGLHHLVQLSIDFLGSPDQTLGVLSHLQSGDAHAAGVTALEGATMMPFC